MSVEWHKLGEYIKEFDERNSDGLTVPVLGLNKEKSFMPTAANLEGIDTTKYKVISQGSFVFSGMQTGRDICIRLGLYGCEDKALVSPAYTTFRLTHKDEILPEYFFLFFNRTESDRLGWFLSDSSVRANLDWPRFLDVEIPIPQIAEQRKVVEAWQGLRKMKEENEQLAEPLLALCRSYLQEIKKEYPMKEIGTWLIEHDVRNTDLVVKLSQGVANTKVFQDPKQVSSNATSDKIVRTGQFAYNRATTRNGEKISVAYREGPDCTVSSAYGIFSITNEDVLDPKFLLLWFCRPEFDRYARYHSWGSAHEFFTFGDMGRVKIPLPPIGVQRAVVALFNAANEAKKIAAEADKLSREICPAFIQRVVKEVA